jgi:5-methylcytosine-specific restriction endonuclease McrA
MSTYGPKFDALSLVLRAGGRCARCKRQFHPSKLDAHHTIPRRYGGPDTASNLEPLCDACHVIRERQVMKSLRMLTGTPKRKIRRRPPQP